MPAQTVKNDHPLTTRVPKWMVQGLEQVAKTKRTDNISLVTRWAIEDLLLREGITAPDETA